MIYFESWNKLELPASSWSLDHRSNIFPKNIKLLEPNLGSRFHTPVLEFLINSNKKLSSEIPTRNKSSKFS
jgi:hypothetical protein